MKKLIFVVGFLLTTNSVFSQEYRKFKLGVGGGFPLLLYIEPAYRVKDNWSIGMRLEGGVINAFSSNGMIMGGSYGLNGQYYFPSKERVRFFSGLGVSLYSIDRSGQMCDCENNYEKNTLGFYPRLGFDTGHLTVTMDYNVMPQIKMVGRSILPGNLNQEYISYVNGNYFAVKIGASIGGGKKK